jgi:hypothetical protein
MQSMSVGYRTNCDWRSKQLLLPSLSKEEILSSGKRYKVWEQDGVTRITPLSSQIVSRK